MKTIPKSIALVGLLFTIGSGIYVQLKAKEYVHFLGDYYTKLFLIHGGLIVVPAIFGVDFFVAFFCCYGAREQAMNIKGKMCIFVMLFFILVLKCLDCDEMTSLEIKTFIRLVIIR